MPHHIRDSVSSKLPDTVTDRLPDKLTNSKGKNDPVPADADRSDSDTAVSHDDHQHEDAPTSNAHGRHPSEPPPNHHIPTTSSSSDSHPPSTQPTSPTTSPSPAHRTRRPIPQDKLDTLTALSHRKYVLKTTCGPTYDPSTHIPLPVNTPHATTISSPHLTAHLKLRIRSFTGLPLSSSPTSPYFSAAEHKKDEYSLAFSFVPKHDIASKDCVWGNDFDHPVRDRLPPGVNTAFKIVKELVEPGLRMDAYADEPWLLGPVGCCWFALRVGDTITPESAEAGDFPVPDEDAMPEDGVGSGVHVREGIGMPPDPEKRRKWMLKAENREKFVFEKGRWYAGDFHNGYLDFNEFKLKLPGFTLGVAKYIDDKTHGFRYVFKDGGTGGVFFVVVLTLLFGDLLEEELKEARRELEREYGWDGDEGDEDAVGGAEEEGDNEFVDAVESMEELKVK